MKKVIATSAAVALAISVFAAPAAAGNGYGKTIKDECGASYGQLVSAGKKAARAGGHPAFTPSGARGFVMNTDSFNLHCPPAPPEE
jgi:hypothetical protein